MGLQTWAHWTSGKAGYNVSNNVIRGDYQKDKKKKKKKRTSIGEDVAKRELSSLLVGM